ncbi:ATP-binding protein [Chitinimonas taiwanensis]|jgi:AAA+ superfamily predicted ATPase|uniref:ATPase family associated with various cellular activities (AAA) n=1 Tax=Chitinimonas taiwanensis DSM 18899 TaxID=1121279 RepID=A0A1K2HRV4_9NEIS|nr:ATP-binding protein [Chitinimonas taiwanensis]SFZ79540.1 ATPase family associated with various cellular activities (AAA) [Chitinimonas taiwanensis DSM 18899]
MSTGVEPRGSLHAEALRQELDWLEAVLELRFKQHFEQQPFALAALAPPALLAGSALAELVAQYGLGARERLLLALAMAPHLRPAALDLFFVKNRNFDRGFSEFGGIKAQRHGGFLPSGETAAFLLAGEDLAARLELLNLFDAEQAFAQSGLVVLEGEVGGEPQLSGLLTVTAEALQRLQSGVWHKPDYNAQFPAKRISSQLGWDELVLAPEVMDEIEIIQSWLRQGPALMQDWGLGRAVKPGYRCLFYGPPGTGKTLTATLLGQSAAVDVYRIDLSMVVSKYIGETEKNLARVFDQAQSRHWILFFDEADALFGKRSATQNSNDRHANQEIAYLLQRIEDFPGVVILASNLRGNIDEAFSRRFQSMIYFPMPDATQRLQLWRSLLNQPERLADDIDLLELAEQHELSGGAMVNVLRFAVLQANREASSQLHARHLQQGLAREMRKEGRTL